MERVTVEEVSKAISEGRLDGDLAAVMTSLAQRFTAVGAQVRWVIDLEKWGLGSVNEDEVTLAEFARAEELSGRNWTTLDPRASARNAMAVILAVIENRLGKSPKDAVAHIADLTGNELIDLTGVAEVDLGPPVGAAA